MLASWIKIIGCVDSVFLPFFLLSLIGDRLGWFCLIMATKLLQVFHNASISRTYLVPVSKGDRVAQLILTKITTPPVLEVDHLESTQRDANGFGSTGK